MENTVRKSVTAVSSRCRISFSYCQKTGFCGEIFNEHFGKSFVFQGEMEMLSAIAGLLNDLGFPQEAFECRSFFKPGKLKTVTRKVCDKMDDNIIPLLSDEKATFVVSVQFRQNASWQGNVTWVEKEQTRRFRSVLELLSLMGEAQGGKELISWEDGGDNR